MPVQSKSLADILALLWASEHEQDFEKLIARVDADRKPSNYTQKTNEELIIAAGVFRLCRWEIVIRIVLEKLDLRWEQANNRANQVAGNFDPATLAWLYFLHPDESLMRLFVGVNLELAEVSREMASRTRERPPRRLVMRFREEDSSSIKALLTEVEKEAARWGNRKLFRPYRRADETTDREQTASLKIQENYLKMGAAGFKDLKDNFAVPIPQIVGLPLDQKKEMALAQFRVAFIEADIAHMANLILPILNGEKLPAKAYQSLRNDDKKVQAQKRTAKEENYGTESLDRVLIERRFGVYKKDEDRLEALEEMGLRKPEEGNPPILLALRRAIKKVIEKRRTKRTQEVTRVFLKELYDHANLADATKAAKLTRPTRKQILLELRRELDAQNLPAGKK